MKTQKLKRLNVNLLVGLVVDFFCSIIVSFVLNLKYLYCVLGRLTEKAYCTLKHLKSQKKSVVMAMGQNSTNIVLLYTLNYKSAKTLKNNC